MDLRFLQRLLSIEATLQGTLFSPTFCVKKGSRPALTILFS